MKAPILYLYIILGVITFSQGCNHEKNRIITNNNKDNLDDYIKRIINEKYISVPIHTLSDSIYIHGLNANIYLLHLTSSGPNDLIIEDCISKERLFLKVDFLPSRLGRWLPVEKIYNIRELDSFLNNSVSISMKDSIPISALDTLFQIYLKAADGLPFDPLELYPKVTTDNIDSLIEEYRANFDVNSYTNYGQPICESLMDYNIELIRSVVKNIPKFLVYSTGKSFAIFLLADKDFEQVCSSKSLFVNRELSKQYYLENGFYIECIYL